MPAIVWPLVNDSIVPSSAGSVHMRKRNASEDGHTTTAVSPNIREQATQEPLVHKTSTESADLIIRTLDDFLSLAKARIGTSDEIFSMFKGPFANFHAAVVVYLDEYARCKLTLTAQEQARRDEKILQDTKHKVELCRSTFLKTCLGSVQGFLTIVTFSMRTTAPPANCKESHIKQPENDIALSAARLIEFENTIVNLKEKLEASEALAKSLALELDQVRKEKEWQHKASEDQQRKLEGSFSQKVEERVTKRVREEQSAVAARLAIAETKARKYDAATVKIDDLEKQVSEMAHEKVTWVATRLKLENETKTLREDKIAIQQGYDQVRKEKDEAELRIMELEEQLGAVAADLDVSKSNFGLENQGGAVPVIGATASEIQIVANNGQDIGMDRLTRIKENLGYQYPKSRKEQRAPPEELGGVEKQMAIQEVELAKHNNGEEQDRRHTRQLPSQLKRADHGTQPGDSSRPKELKTKSAVGTIFHNN